MPAGVFKKSVLAALWIVPTVLLSAVAAGPFLHPPPAPAVTVQPPVKVPIEVITKDQGLKIVYVEIDPATVPEPSLAMLLPLSLSLLLVRRR